MHKKFYMALTRHLLNGSCTERLHGSCTCREFDQQLTNNVWIDIILQAFGEALYFSSVGNTQMYTKLFITLAISSYSRQHEHRITHFRCSDQKQCSLDLELIHTSQQYERRHCGTEANGTPKVCFTTLQQRCSRNCNHHPTCSYIFTHTSVAEGLDHQCNQGFDRHRYSLGNLDTNCTGSNEGRV